MTPKIFIATPMYGGQCYGTYANSMISFIGNLEKRGWLGTWSFLYNESLITRGRNTLVHQFLKTDCTHLMFIDADISFQSIDAIKMIETKKEVIAGIYPKKTINWSLVEEAVKQGYPAERLKEICSEFAFLPKIGEERVLDRSSDIPFAVDAVGTGFMLIDRNVFEQLDVQSYTSHNETFYGEDIKMFFETRVDEDSGLNDYLSEDYSFCKYCNDAGIPVYLAPWTRLKHTGTQIFG